MARRASRWRKTVERAFGELINVLGIKKVNTLGIENANKKFITAAFTYNLKKFLKYGYKYVSSPALALKNYMNNNSQIKIKSQRFSSGKYARFRFNILLISL